MYLRLWWKDARQFWPIWTFLVLAAGVTQALVLHYAEPGSWDGRILVVLALGWAALYAFAVGAAAFAGERETGTLRFLDILPASRRIVWAGKVSFAFVTTLALAGVLLAMAALGPSWGGFRGAGDALLMMTGVLLHGLILGLFLSSIMNNALLAALAAMGLTTLSWIGLLSRLDQGFRKAYDREGLTWYFGIALAALIGSHIAFTWNRRTHRARLPIRFQSPIVLTWSRSPRTGRGPLRVQPPGATAMPVPVPVPAGVVSPPAWSADRPRPRSWLTEFRYLAWQTMREGRRIWLLFAIGLIVPIGLFLLGADLLGTDLLDPTLFAGLNWLVALMAGIRVFGADNPGRTYQFLVHHGARPGTVWLAKLATWCFGLAIIWVPLVILAFEFGRQVGPRSSLYQWFWVVLVLPLIFAVAQLCGMVIRRGITAGVVAIVVTITLGFAQVGLLTGNMMPFSGPLPILVAFPVVTWAWRRDWLMDRPAPGRYLRLGLILTGTFGVLLAGYAGERAWSIPDPGSIAPPSSWAAAPIPPDRNAADLYREAARVLSEDMPNLAIRSSGRTREALDLIRRAAARPDCQFQRTDRLTLLSRPGLPPMSELDKAVSHHARDRISQSDLAGAWDDIAVLLRMARHLSEEAMMSQSLQALHMEKEALGLARDWATAPGQTPERLRAALAAYRDLPRLTPITEVIRGEAILFERTIDLPTDDLKGLLLETLVGRRRLADGNIPIWTSLYIDMITTPWERERARRVNRQYASSLTREASLEPWRQQLGPGSPIAQDLTAPLARYLAGDTGSCLNAEDRIEVGRRALVQVMAIRSWQLRHDGRFPDRLEELVPGELPSLPADPYTGRPFGYITYADANLSSLLLVFQVGGMGNPNTLPKETRLLYSFGPNRLDVLRTNSAAGWLLDDIVFAIPPIGAKAPDKAAAPGNQGGEPAKPQ